MAPTTQTTQTAPTARPPSVTRADLTAFWLHHFAPPADPDATPDAADDALEHYADGTPRAITDAEIAIFRHSEIHALLRQRRRAQDEPDHADAAPKKPAPSTTRRTSAPRPAKHANGYDPTWHWSNNRRVREADNVAAGPAVELDYG